MIRSHNSLNDLTVGNTYNIIIKCKSIAIRRGTPMIKKLIQLLTIMLLMTFTVAMTIHLVSSKSRNEVGSEVKASAEGSEHKLKIVTTIYPVYMIGLNIANQINNIEVSSLIKLNTGCLHDYQLTTKDMKLIATADVLVINGGGMEGFLSDIKANYPKLKIIDASQGISMIPGDEEEHNHDVSENEEHIDSKSEEGQEEKHEHGAYNPHVWLDPQLYIQQIQNVKNGLIEYIHEGNKKAYFNDLDTRINENTDIYIQKVEKVNDLIEECRIRLQNASAKSNDNNGVVIFHDSFAYLAKRLNMKVAFAVELEADTSLSAAEIATIIDEVKKDRIKRLFTESQYSDSIARQIGEESGAKVTIIDSAVTGDGGKDSYLNSMMNNIKVLKNMEK